MPLFLKPRLGNTYYFGAEDETDDESSGSNWKTKLPEEETVTYKLQPVFSYFGFFGQFLFRPPDMEHESLRWHFKLTYAFVAVSLLLVFGVDHVVDYRIKVFQDEPCSNAACVIRQMPGLVYGSVVSIIGTYSFFAYRSFTNVLVQWNSLAADIYTRFQRCHPGTTRSRFKVTRKKIACILVAYFFYAVILDHLFGDVYMAYNCVTKMGDDCNFFAFYVHTVSHKKEFDKNSNQLNNIILYVSSKLALIQWNFTDFLVITIGVCLTDTFSMFNVCCEDIVIQKKSELKWARKTHHKLCGLVQSIDCMMSPAILTSMAAACFFTCHQCYFHIYRNIVFNLSDNFYEIIHGFFSVSHLLIRMGAACIIGSFVFDSMRKPLTLLLQQHRMEEDCIETFRFLDQVADVRSAFTAMRLFTLKKEVLLHIIGIVVTYEMLLISFDKATHNASTYDDRDEYI